MRFFPRQAKSRQDALMGKGHIGNKSTSDVKTAQDRMLRYRPDIDTATMVSSTLSCYGGTAG